MSTADSILEVRDLVTAFDTDNGRLVAVVRAATSAGPVTVTLQAEGLPTQTVRLDAVSR